MKLEITKTEKNPLLYREEIEFKVMDSSTTPSRKELIEKIAANSKADVKQIVIKIVAPMFGSTKVSGKAYIYDNEKRLKQIEPKYLIERTFGKEKKEEAKKEEIPAPPKKQEKK